MKLEEYIKGIKQGDKRTLSKAITLAESSLDAQYDLALKIIEHFSPKGNSRRIGITGTPGAGKSTFINAYGEYLIKKEAGVKIAVLSIDPSSTISGGSILGDKTRMTDLAKYDKVFIRPSASGSHWGGLAKSTRLAILLCEAAGYDHIFIESVGVGQGETEIAKLTDLFLLLLNPGGGDELQGIKRGIVEMADLLVVNKADEDRMAIAKQTAKDYRNAQQLMPNTESGWKPKVVMCSALNKEGIEKVALAISDFFAHIDPDYKTQERTRQQEYWVYRILEDQLIKAIKSKDLDLNTSLQKGLLPERIALEWSKKFFD